MLYAPTSSLFLSPRPRSLSRHSCLPAFAAPSAAQPTCRVWGLWGCYAESLGLKGGLSIESRVYGWFKFASDFNQASGLGFMGALCTESRVYGLFKLGIEFMGGLKLRV